MSILTGPRQGVIYAVAADKTNGVLDSGASAAIRYLLREGLGPLYPPAVVVPGQREGDISRRSDKFAPDYAPVTFIFIEILHSNERSYFSYRAGALDLSLSSRLFRPPTEQLFADKRKNAYIDTQTIENEHNVRIENNYSRQHLLINHSYSENINCVSIF